MLIQQDNFIQKLLALEKGRAYIPNVRKKRSFFLNKLTDARLVKYIRRGNSHAFEVLIKRHEPKLKYLLRSNLFDKSQVDDVAQDVWEAVVHRLRSRAYRETGQFYGWLSTMAFRKAMNVNRQKLYNPETVEYDPRVHDAADAAESDEPSEQILKTAKKLIATFNETDREIIRMHYEEKLTLEAIARKMNLNRKGVEKRHLRALHKIRGELKIS